MKTRNIKKTFDYRDFRSFIFLLHDKYGILLLYNTKKSRGPYYQLPGGHLEAEDFGDRKLKTISVEATLLATKIGASRELYEETGIDVRSKLDRLQPAIVNNELNHNMIEYRYYYYLFVTDVDFLIPDHTVTGYCTPISGQNLFIKISEEHTSWIFERDIQKASKMIELHSSGYGKIALENMMQRNDHPFFESRLKYYYPYEDAENINSSSLFPCKIFFTFAAFLLTCSFILRKCFMKPRLSNLH